MSELHGKIAAAIDQENIPELKSLLKGFKIHDAVKSF